MALLPPRRRSAGPERPQVRVREYFPETMLWQPALITDDRGIATLPLTFADSITTWRLTASASARAGLLGGVTTPLRVFQPFFVDLDLPVSLTRNDEVAFPVAVYSYLKEPQTVKLQLQKEGWFELLPGEELTRTVSSGIETSIAGHHEPRLELEQQVIEHLNAGQVVLVGGLAGSPLCQRHLRQSHPDISVAMGGEWFPKRAQATPSSRSRRRPRRGRAQAT